MRRHTHLGAYALVRTGTDSGPVLLVQKARGPYIGAWDLPGGGLQWGESPEQAVRREVSEETGLFLPPHLGTLPPLSHTVEWQTYDEWEELHHLGIIFAVILPFPPPAVRDGGDRQDAAAACWFPPTHLPFSLTPFAKRVLRR